MWSALDCRRHLRKNRNIQITGTPWPERFEVGDSGWHSKRKKKRNTFIYATQRHPGSFVGLRWGESVNPAWGLKFEFMNKSKMDERELVLGIKESIIFVM